MLKKHRITALLASVGLATGFMATVPIASASATANCRVTVTQIQAWELQDGDGQDEIRFELGDDTYGTFNFTQGMYRNSRWVALARTRRRRARACTSRSGTGTTRRPRPSARAR